MLACRLLIESRRAPPESIGFHAHQACEKFIKARIVLSGAVVSRTHDLDYLADLAAQHGVEAPAPRDMLRQLNPYAVAFRYESHHDAALDELRLLVVLEALHRWCGSALGDAERR